MWFIVFKRVTFPESLIKSFFTGPRKKDKKLKLTKKYRLHFSPEFPENLLFSLYMRDELLVCP